MFERNRTRPFLIRYALYLYFLGLSLRNTSKAIKPFEERSYVAYGIGYRNSIQKTFFPIRIAGWPAFITCETVAQIGDTDAWLWVATYPIHRKIFWCLYPKI
jgi:hypothetical protein